MTSRDIGNEIIQSMADAIEYIRGNTSAVKINNIEIPSLSDCSQVKKIKHSNSELNSQLDEQQAEKITTI